MGVSVVIYLLNFVYLFDFPLTELGGYFDTLAPFKPPGKKKQSS